MDTVFSAQLQKLRKERNVTQETLAAHLGVSPQAVSKWENGSYPDGDLLPKIADFFGVSIDFLYGRAKEDASVVQQIIDELQNLGSDNEICEELFLEQTFKYSWAAQIAAWKTNKYYYERPDIDGSDSITAAEINGKAGFTYMRLNKDLEYFFLVKQPKEGFAKRLKITDETAELFAFLGDKTNLKILEYMLTFKWQEAVRAKTVAADMMCEKADKLSGEMVGCWSGQMRQIRPNNMIMNIVNALRDGISYFYIGFLAVTKAITIGDFQMCVSSASNLYWSLYHIVSSAQELHKRCSYAHRYLEFTAYPAAMVKGTKSVKKSGHTIEFSHVSFKYPRSEKYVLRDVNITIRSGEHLSIVGLNGAGEVLCGLQWIKAFCPLQVSLP